MTARSAGGVTTTPADSDVVEALQARIRDLEAVLGQNNHGIAVSLRLPAALSKVLGLLLAVPNVTSDMITQRLEIATDAKVAMHRLRAAMKPHGVVIHSRRNLGYWLEDPDKQRIREMLALVEPASPDGSVPKPQLVVDNAA